MLNAGHTCCHIRSVLILLWIAQNALERRKKLKKLTTNEVVNLLAGLGFGRFGSNFVDGAMDGAMLAMLPSVGDLNKYIDKPVCARTFFAKIMEYRKHGVPLNLIAASAIGRVCLVFCS